MYPCPRGYCRCFHNLCNIGNETCSYAYFNSDPDKQCNCDRKGQQCSEHTNEKSMDVHLSLGYLCGDCKGSKGVSSLLNHCVECSDINIVLLAALCKTLTA